ncbi:hypothetical protein [Streptomyces sp. NPDC085466]|uniref:hypothetical protein n=1 Tax=Streptomyces sp. NPDC085466 TaxID=3365725 RepID=UPI0037D8ACCD
MDSGGTQAAAPAPIKAADADVHSDERRPVHPKLVTRGANDAFPALYAHLSGTLVITDEHCVAVTTAKTGKPTTIVWGHGWSVREDGGKATVYDAEGEPFAREGDRVGLGGGTSERFAGEPCVTGTVFEANDTQTAP